MQQHVPLKTLGGVALACLTIAACFVSRPSDGYSCKTTADCKDVGRQCESGFCVIPNCPSDCTSCDEGAKTCAITCTSSNDCGSVTCPMGWDCTITCTGDGACNNITCETDSKCTITCSGSNACNDVSCRDACKCDLTCSTSGACGDTLSCPTATGGTKCTTDVTSGSPCLSTAAGCTKC